MQKVTTLYNNSDSRCQKVLLCFQPLSSAYHELASSYTSNNPNEVRTVATKNEDTFRTVSDVFMLHGI